MLLRCEPQPRCEISASPEVGDGGSQGDQCCGGDRTDTGDRRKTACIFVFLGTLRDLLVQQLHLIFQNMQRIDQDVEHRPCRIGYAAGRVPYKLDQSWDMRWPLR